VPLRLGALCGLLVPVAFVVGLVVGDLVQPEAFSPADDNISDLGALTASSPLLYNQVEHHRRRGVHPRVDHRLGPLAGARRLPLARDC
jgi:hypothetical protein